MSKLDDVLKLARKQDYTILLDKDGSRKFCVVPVDREHISYMTQRLEDQLKAEGKLGYYVGMIMPVSCEPGMDFLPIYGRTDKYETKWLRRNIEDAVADELKDRGSELYKRILAYEPNVTAIKSKTESIGKLHIKESNSLLDTTINKIETAFAEQGNGAEIIQNGKNYYIYMQNDGNYRIDDKANIWTKQTFCKIVPTIEKLAKVIINLEESVVYESQKYSDVELEDNSKFDDNSSISTKNNDNEYIKIGKAIANYYDEISFNSNGIIIYTDKKKALYTEITNALKSIESK